MAAGNYRFFDFEVARTRRVSPSVQRVTFRSPVPGGIAEFASGGRDQRFKLFFPQPGEELADIPVEAGDQWYVAWRAMDPNRRALMRTYTVREQRRELGEIDVDFAVRTSPGPAAAWALLCLAGDRITALGPDEADNAGIDFRAPPGTDWILVAGDESALPAIAGILEWISPATPVRAWIEIAHCDDVQPLQTWSDAEITWLVRGVGPSLTDAVTAARLPAGTPYAWIAGEATEVRRLRRHLVGGRRGDGGGSGASGFGGGASGFGGGRGRDGRGIDRKRVTFTGYWRRGATAEDLLKELPATSAAG
jgi:NADPH-dependent ferric siderophore reductase